MSITDEELKNIEDRAKKATPGPWEVHHDLRPDIVNQGIWEQAKDAETTISTALYKGGYYDEGQLIRYMSKLPGHICELAKYWVNEQTSHSNYDDAEFIAHARTDIPALLEEIKRLKTPHYLTVPKWEAKNRKKLGNTAAIWWRNWLGMGQPDPMDTDHWSSWTEWNWAVVRDYGYHERTDYQVVVVSGPYLPPDDWRDK